jgi:tRNA(Ile2) C34 agmatinyltransferase TiaS
MNHSQRDLVGVLIRTVVCPRCQGEMVSAAKKNKQCPFCGKRFDPSKREKK